MAAVPPPPPGRDKVLEFLSKIPGIGAILNLPENTRITVEQWLASGYGGLLKYFGKPILYYLGVAVPGAFGLYYGFKYGNKDAIILGNQLLGKLIDPSPREVEELIDNIKELSEALGKLDAEGIKSALFRPKYELSAPFERIKELFKIEIPKPAVAPPAPKPALAPPAPKKPKRRFR